MFTFYFFQQLLCHTQPSTFPSWNHSTKIKGVKIESKHDFIEHKLVSEIECILGVRQTKQVDKQYLVNGNGATQREWVKQSHIDHLLEMVDKFELEKGSMK